MKNLKKILAVIMAMAMVIGSISTTALAGLMEIEDEGNNLIVYYYDSTGAQIGSKYYGSTEDFSEIFTNAPTGAVSEKIMPSDTLYVEDITSTLVIPAGEDVTFDLNGNDVTTSIKLFSVEGTSGNTAKLTLVNSGADASIKASENHDGNGTISANAYGMLTISNIKLTGADSTPIIYNEGTFVAKADDDGNVPYVNGTIGGTGAFKMSAGYYSETAGTYDEWLDTTLERSDVGTNLKFEHIANSDATYISKIVEKTHVCQTNSKYYYSVKTAFSYAGSSGIVTLLADTSEDIIEGEEEAYFENVTLDLNSYTLTGAITGSEVDIEDNATGGKITGSVDVQNISGGTFLGTVKASSITGGTFDAAVEASSITGGKFKTTHVTIAEGYTDSTPSGGYTEVVEKKACENLTTKVQYNSLQEAIDEASNGETIKILKSINNDATVAATQNIVIDTAGYECSGTITNEGLLTVTDSLNTSSSKTGKIEAIINNEDATLSLSGIVNITSLSNAGEAINIASDITGSSIGLDWATLTKSTVATKADGVEVDLSSYIGTIFVEEFDTYELVVDGNSIYLVSLSIDAVSMTLANELAMNYYCTVPYDLLTEMGNCIFLEVTCDADPTGTQYISGVLATKDKVTKTDEITGEDKTFHQYIFTFNGIDPTWMSSDLTARVYIAQEGTTTFDASKAYDSNVYSVAEYINDLYNNIETTKDDPTANTNPNIPTENIQSYYEHMETLIADILMYGKTAQIYRDVATDALCTQVTYEYNEGVRTMVKHSADLEWITSHASTTEPTSADNIMQRYAKNTNKTNLDIDYDATKIAGAQCLFGKGGYIAPRFLVAANADDVAAGKIAVEVSRYNDDGEIIATMIVPLETSNMHGSYYYIEIGGTEDLDFQFYPQDFDQKITASLLVKTTVGTQRTLQMFDYSINSYCCGWIGDTSIKGMSDFALATYRYGKSTQALYSDLYE